jgi:hypothetical protein
MKAYNILSLLLFFVLFFSCSMINKDKRHDSSPELRFGSKINDKETLSHEMDTSLNLDKDFKLDYIYPIPAVVLYGGGSFTYDSIENSPGKHIFLSNLSEDTAIINLRGKLFYLSYDSIRSIPRFDDSIKVVWKSNSLFAILKLKVIDETGDEINCKGVIEIITKEVSKKFDIHGGYTD